MSYHDGGLIWLGIALAMSACAGKGAQAPEERQPTLTGVVSLEGTVRHAPGPRAAALNLELDKAFPLQGTLSLAPSSAVQFAWMDGLSRNDARCSAGAEPLEVNLSDAETIRRRCTVTSTTISLDAFAPKDERIVLLVARGAEDIWAIDDPDGIEKRCLDRTLGLTPKVPFDPGTTDRDKARKIAELAWHRLAVLGEHGAALAVAARCELPAAKKLAEQKTAPMAKDKLEALLAGCGVLEAMEACKQKP